VTSDPFSQNLANFLRSLADELLLRGVVQETIQFRLWRETIEGQPEVDAEGRSWATHTVGNKRTLTLAFEFQEEPNENDSTG